MEFAIRLEADGHIALYRQLYEERRRAILAGRLARGERLPSTRSLAESLGLSRSTVTLSFSQLISEGYLEATIGAGTFVSRELPDEKTPGKRRAIRRSGTPLFRLSTYGETLAQTGPLEAPRTPGSIDFHDGRPAFDQFPYSVWRRLLARHVRAADKLFDYSNDAAGYRPLREALAAYLIRSRAVRCTAADIIVVSSSQQAIDLTARLLVERGDVVAVEDPGYLGAHRTFAAHGAKLRGIAVDRDGMRVSELFALEDDVRLVYVTPSHQYPTGTVLSLGRRLELLRWAQRTGAVVIEDDYDSAYRYEERAIPALQGLDDRGATIYMGTFSKTMYPALRIGYVVVPPTLRAVFTQAKAFSDRQSPILEQCALADFIAEGHFERHLRRMRTLYSKRRQTLIEELQRSVNDIDILGDSAGMHVLVRLRTSDEHRLIECAQRAGVALMSAEPLYLSGSSPDG